MKCNTIHDQLTQLLFGHFSFLVIPSHHEIHLMQGKVGNEGKIKCLTTNCFFWVTSLVSVALAKKDNMQAACRTKCN